MKKISVKNLRKTMFLTPIKETKYGCKQVNMNIKANILKKYDKFNVGDRIICTKNSQDYGVSCNEIIYNGNLFYIKDIIKQEQQYIVYSDDDYNKFIMLTHDDMKHFKLAWCITVHKSQGKEWDNVVMLIPSDSRFMMNNNLIYTGVTRASKKCTILADLSVFEYGINRSQYMQQTQLVNCKHNKVVYNKYDNFKLLD